MNSLRKMLALTLCLVFIVGCLASCDILDSLGGQNKSPDSYEATVRIVFASNDEKIVSALDTNSDSKIMVDGENMQILTRTKTNSLSAENTYTLADGVLYHKLSVSNGVLSADQLTRADMGENESYLLLIAVGPGADIGIDDFANVNKNGTSDNCSYSCKSINEDAKVGIQSILSEKLAIIGGTVTLVDATYSLETEDGLDKSATLSCNLLVTLDGQSYEVTMRTYTDYDYDVDFSDITSPENAAEYTKVSFEEILK